MPVIRQQLENYIGQLLELGRFRDYCPNGLQIEGRESIRSIATAVTASQAAIDEAIALGADALLVHHGFFWKNESPPLVRSKKHRIAALLRHDINLFGYHLPLDAHPELGNNARLGQLLGLQPTGRTGEQDMVWLGELPEPIQWHEWQARIDSATGRTCLAIPGRTAVKRVAWCTGGAQSYFHDVAALDVDCYLTGEASEFVTHLARESGVGFIAAGHHATERYGIRALGEHLAKQFELELHHIEIDNPV
ncbi:Nif3-like dinuclear metal center hexameric protein [Chitinilyticum piscinae]|uniref:Nif3-like dinuclear metal center hexameric protein n=1 Tax=Chitinilyticum piscinae TaxID=2866724 RepID=A0A8J7FM91_9NEIS|nr:Nif3-like dinuclear metal center hexameric protein [Chitinilyticum piscinae]MBE9610542.1 Nif3-like dinuclear metal center hexameric protein [Chitinilyticum piscinae]